MLARLLPAVILAGGLLCAETGHEAWLRYAPIQDAKLKQRYSGLPAALTVLGDSPVLASAREELIRGLGGMLGRTLRIEAGMPKESAIVLGTIAEVRRVIPGLPQADLKEDAFWITTATAGPLRHIVVAARNERGVLYGTFALLRKIALLETVTPIDEKQTSAVAARWINHWENLDGTIERGYGGRSIFYENNEVRQDLSLVRDYARLLASLGINAISINNVNANPRVITAEFLPQVARIAEIFRPWGVRIALAVDFSSPQRIGKLDTFDPLDARVIAWWKDKIDEIYRAVPDLAGIVIKADSEGRLGPSAYGRTHADAANVLARPLKPHGGLIFYRGFVYDHRMDWRNLKNDRARAACDNFVKLDGQFEDNAIVQIKHGPIDFQVREPASPLFGALEKTPTAVELQITQEYFGQGRHLVFLIPMWKEALDFDMRVGAAPSPVKKLVRGFVGVSNVGRDANWFGHHLSQANLYGFGRLAWNPDLSAARIADEWTKLTYGHDPRVVSTISDMQLRSWRTFENYTGPLGAQTLTEITGNHYGPAIEASERNGWGQWHRADEKGIGMDRTVATGTGFIGQYRPGAARIYEPLKDCPDELLLFMHHVPYTHLLHSGKTVIQHIYDSHYDGAEDAGRYPRQWASLRGLIDEQRFGEVLARLEYQAGHAIVWRDAVNNWFFTTSKIPDARGRVGKHPGRIEAESMELEGYRVSDVKPFEAASGSKAIECASPSRECAASLRYEGKPGWFDLAVEYFDQNNGASRYRVFVGEQQVDEWLATDTIPTRRVDAHSSTRRTIRGLALRTGDVIRIKGTGQGGENAALDYVEILPARD